MSFLSTIVLVIMAYLIYQLIKPSQRDFLSNVGISSLTSEEWGKLHNRDKLGNYLPYSVYDNIKGIYHNNNGTYGIVEKIAPRQFAGKQTAEGFQEILSKMFPSMTLQVMMYGSKNDYGMIDVWQKMHKQRANEKGFVSETVKEIMNLTVDNMASFFRKKFNEPISTQMTTQLKDFRIYFSVTSKDLDEIIVFKKILRDILEGNRFYPEEISPNEMKTLLWELLNSNHRLDEIPSYDENKELNRQLIAPDTEIQFTDHYSKLDDRYWINMSPMRYPEYASISDMGMKIGDYISAAMNTNQFKENFIISMSYSKQDKKQLNSAKRNHSIILTQNWSELLFRKFNDVRKESVSILDRIDVKKESLFYVDMNVLVSGSNYKSAQQNASVIASYWNKGGKTSSIVLAETKGIQQLCFLASLPMGATSEYLSATDKSRSMFSEQASQFVPLECDWKGNGTPNILLSSRRGQLVGFDMFISNNNYNGYLIAESGSGKSVFLNILAFLAYTRGDRVFIQDFGGSFKKLCSIVGGQYIEPDRKTPFSLNPFSEIINEAHLTDELDFLSTFVYSLGANKNREQYEKDEKLLKSYIQDIIKACYERNGASMEVTDIKDNLFATYGKKEAKIGDFCQQISMYCHGGIYEKFLAGKCAVDFSNHFLVAEIQQIEKDEDIRDPIIMLLTYHQSNAIYKTGNTEQRILNIYDEAHKYVGKDPRMDDFIEQNYRRGRKQNASSIIATQGFEDIYDSGTRTLSRAGKAIINSSSWKFFLKQSETSINLLLKAGVFSMNPIDEELLRTTKTILGEYSEIFIITPEEYKYVYRLILDKFFYYLTSTNATDKNRLDSKMSQGMKLEDAIKAVISEDEESQRRY